MFVRNESRWRIKKKEKCLAEIKFFLGFEFTLTINEKKKIE